MIIFPSFSVDSVDPDETGAKLLIGQSNPDTHFDILSAPFRNIFLRNTCMQAFGGIYITFSSV